MERRADKNRDDGRQTDLQKLAPKHRPRCVGHAEDAQRPTLPRRDGCPDPASAEAAATSARTASMTAPSFIALSDL